MIDLHTHLGGAVPASVLWEILCDSGLQTEFKTFDDLQDFLTVNPGDIKNLDDFLNLYFHSTELIQSSPQAAYTAIYQAVAKAYRRAQISGMEVRFNPLKRLRHGLHSLDSIILAAVQGLQRASMHYQVRTGIIFSMGKELSHENNWRIVQAAIRFKSHGVLHGAYGVVGIDMAGPESLGRDLDMEWLKEVKKMVEEARKAKLGVTWHVAETGHSGPQGLENVLKMIEPDRIGHGIQIRKAEGAQKDRIIGMMRERQILMEVCPSVNVITRSLENYAEAAGVIKLLDESNIPFCLNTDNPYIIHTNLAKEYQLLEKELGAGFELKNKSRKHLEFATFLQ
jgi:adenosine deaminase